MPEPTVVERWTAFAGSRLVVSGAPAEVAVALRDTVDASDPSSILVFDDATGRIVDLDLRGSLDDVWQRYGSKAEEPTTARGRPKLGVVAREVTLLPRHWDWLATQPGGASAVLRRLVDATRSTHRDRDRARTAQAAADRFMRAMAGDAPGYEEATRALYAGNAAVFHARIAEWPNDVRDHAMRLAADAFGAVETAA